MARLAPPTARVPRHAAGRPVSWACASAMNAAAPSCRVATTLMPAALQPVEQAQEALAGHGERVADAGRAQGVGEMRPTVTAAGRRPARVRRSPPRARVRRFGRGFGFRRGLGLGSRFGAAGSGSAAGSGFRRGLRGSTTSRPRRRRAASAAAGSGQRLGLAAASGSGASSIVGPPCARRPSVHEGRGDRRTGRSLKITMRRHRDEQDRAIRAPGSTAIYR